MSRYECERSWRVNVVLTHVAQMKAFVSHAESTFAAGVDIMVNNGACVDSAPSRRALTDPLSCLCCAQPE